MIASATLTCIARFHTLGIKCGLPFQQWKTTAKSCSRRHRKREWDTLTHSNTHTKHFDVIKNFVCFILIRLQVDSNQKLRQNHVAQPQWSDIEWAECLAFCHEISYINWVQKYLCMYVFTTATSIELAQQCGYGRFEFTHWTHWKNSAKHEPHRTKHTHTWTTKTFHVLHHLHFILSTRSRLKPRR